MLPVGGMKIEWPGRVVEGGGVTDDACAFLLSIVAVRLVSGETLPAVLRPSGMGLEPPGRLEEEVGVTDVWLLFVLGDEEERAATSASKEATERRREPRLSVGCSLVTVAGKRGW